MKPIRVQTIFSEPLAGCLPICRDPDNAYNMLRAILLRLRLFYKEDVCTKLFDDITEGSKRTAVPQNEYLINEVQYEIRRAGKEYDPQFEAVLINTWLKDLITRIPEDDAYAFMRDLKANRENRTRK